jgi:hypothetical protein
MLLEIFLLFQTVPRFDISSIKMEYTFSASQINRWSKYKVLYINIRIGRYSYKFKEIMSYCHTFLEILLKPDSHPTFLTQFGEPGRS